MLKTFLHYAIILIFVLSIIGGICYSSSRDVDRAKRITNELELENKRIISKFNELNYHYKRAVKEVEHLRIENHQLKQLASIIAKANKFSVRLIEEIIDLNRRSGELLKSVET